MASPIVLTTNPFLAAHGDLRWARAVTLYMTDDFAAAHAHARWRRAYDAAWAAIRRREVRVAAVSEAILNRMAPTGPTRVVPNGVDPSEWDEPGSPPEWLTTLPKPWLVYTGGIDDRIDLDAVAATAAAFPGGSIVLVGLPLDLDHIARLQRIDTVVVRPPIPRAELAATVFAADTCLLPHRRTALTEAMSPLKLFEYLAAGTPVASIDLPPLRGWSDRVLFSNSPDGFAEAVRRAIGLGAAPESARRNFADANSWARRHHDLVTFALGDKVLP